MSMVDTQDTQDFEKRRFIGVSIHTNVVSYAEYIRVLHNQSLGYY